MPPSTNHALLLDPHLNLSPAAFVAAWNEHAGTVATARLPTFHFPLITELRLVTNIIRLSCDQTLEPRQLHNLIRAVVIHCGVDRPLRFHQITRPDGGPLTLVMAQNLTIT